MQLVLYDGPSGTLKTVVTCRVGQLMMSGHAVKPLQLAPGRCELVPATADRVQHYQHLDYYVRRDGLWHLGRVAAWDGPVPEWHVLPKAILFHVDGDTKNHGIAMFARVDEPTFPFPDHPLTAIFLAGMKCS